MVSAGGSDSSTMLMVPIKGRILFPGAVLTLKIGRPKTVAVIKRVLDDLKGKRRPGMVGIVCAIPKEGEGIEDELPLDSLHNVACAARVLRIDRSQASDYIYSVKVEGVKRIKIERFVEHASHYEAVVSQLHDVGNEKGDVEMVALTVNLRRTAGEFLSNKVVKLPSGYADQLRQLIQNTPGPALPDLLTALLLNVSLEEKLAVLDACDVKKRMTLTLQLLQRQVEILDMSQKIREDVASKLTKTQREYYLRQQLKAIQKELGDDGKAEAGDLDALAQRAEDCGMNEAASKVVEREIKKLRTLEPSHPEYSIVRTHVECLIDLPWNKREDTMTEDTPAGFVARARRQLEADHFGLEKVKKRMLEYLAVRRLLESNVRGPILCLVGPPGVGKTSLGRSVAQALGRRFHRIALGGVSDEAEIRGHRQTYIGALPGVIMQGMRKVGVCNPVILLDEVDKLGTSIRGDASAALLEVLDPEQNDSFTDHYLGVPFDLSEVVFITTANDGDRIPAALMDRMEVIHVSGYTIYEKIEIARRFLLPKQVEKHGLVGGLQVPDSLLSHLITSYTQEAGVRGLERDIAAVCRGVALELAEADDGGSGPGMRGGAPVEVTMEKLEAILGPVRVHDDVERSLVPGVAVGLAWTSTGSGAVLHVETASMPGKGIMTLTGKLGDVMKESCQAAVSWIRAHAPELRITSDMDAGSLLDKVDLHIHFPAGAVPKDGPSAGITIAMALVSLFVGERVRPDTAMTGEISLRGVVLPVGGIKEKVLAAHRKGIKRVIMPKLNEKDLVDVPERVRSEMEFKFVARVEEVLPHCFSMPFAFPSASEGAALSLATAAGRPPLLAARL